MFENSESDKFDKNWKSSVAETPFIYTSMFNIE